MKYFQNRKTDYICVPRPHADNTSKNRTAGWIIAAAIWACFYAWLAMAGRQIHAARSAHSFGCANSDGAFGDHDHDLPAVGTPAGHHAGRHLSGTPLGLNADA